MSARRGAITENFVRNLDDIRRFLTEQDAQRAFDELVVTVFDQLVPNLERFPDMGRDFLAAVPQSAEGVDQLRRLRMRMGPDTSLREYITGSYLVLYAVRGDELFLLSIKPHRQLSFDLLGHWM